MVCTENTVLYQGTRDVSLSLCTSELIEDDGSELGSTIFETTLHHTCHVMLHSQLEERVRGEEGDGGEGRRYLVEKGAHFMDMSSDGLHQLSQQLAPLFSL